MGEGLPARQRLWAAVIVSLLLHALLLSLLRVSLDMRPPLASSALEVSLSPAMDKKPEAHAVLPVHPPPPPRPVRPSRHPVTSGRPVTPVMTAPDSSVRIPAAPPVEPLRPPTPPQPAPPPPAADMQAYVNAARERRRQAEGGAAPAPHSDEDDRDARIKRNLQAGGTNGVFQILSKEPYQATFAFRGWKNDISFSRREVYQVEISPGGDLRHEVIRKMIEIIRRYYNADFRWDSYRLGQVVTLSAREEDTAELERFLSAEFF